MKRIMALFLLMSLFMAACAPAAVDEPQGSPDQPDEAAAGPMVTVYRHPT